MQSNLEPFNNSHAILQQLLDGQADIRSGQERLERCHERLLSRVDQAENTALSAIRSSANLGHEVKGDLRQQELKISGVEDDQVMNEGKMDRLLKEVSELRRSVRDVHIQFSTLGRELLDKIGGTFHRGSQYLHLF